MGDLEPVYDPLTITSELTLPESATQTRGNIFVEQVEFSYGESPRTPPLEGTSLHRRNTSVERPWGILSLFTTRSRLRVNFPCLKLCHRHLCEAGRFSYGESPRTPPLEGTSLHRRNKCGETLGDFEPVYDPFPTSSEFTLPAAVMTQTCGVFVEQVVFLTVNHRGPLPLRELHSLSLIHI